MWFNLQIRFLCISATFSCLICFIEEKKFAFHVFTKSETKRTSCFIAFRNIREFYKFLDMLKPILEQFEPLFWNAFWTDFFLNQISNFRLNLHDIHHWWTHDHTIFVNIFFDNTLSKFTRSDSVNFVE